MELTHISARIHENKQEPIFRKSFEQNDNDALLLKNVYQGNLKFSQL